MICFPCGRSMHDDCANLFNSLGKRRVKGEETKTWCDCMHRTGVILQAQACKHINKVDNHCPTCGTDLGNTSQWEYPEAWISPSN